MADELNHYKRALREKEQEVRMLGSKTKQLLHGMQDEAQERRAAHREAAHARQRARDKYDDCEEARDLYAQGNERRHHADQRGARLAKQLHESASALKRLHAAHAIERARRKEAEAALARCQAALDVSAADLKRARADKTKALAGVGAFVVSCSCAVANSMATGKRSAASEQQQQQQQQQQQSRGCEAVLDLSNAGLGDEGAYALAEAFRRALTPSVRTALAVESDADGRASVHALPFSLQLRGNAIGNAGCAALAAALSACPSIMSLDLGGNTIGAAGLRALLAGVVEQRGAALRRGRAAATAAASAAGGSADDPISRDAVSRELLPTLRALDLSGNPIPRAARSLGHWRAMVGAAVGSSVTASLAGVPEPTAKERASQGAAAPAAVPQPPPPQQEQQQQQQQQQEKAKPHKARWQPICGMTACEPSIAWPRTNRSRPRSAPSCCELVAVEGEAHPRRSVAGEVARLPTVPATANWRPPVQLALPQDDGGGWAAPRQSDGSASGGSGGCGAASAVADSSNRTAELTSRVVAMQAQLQRVHGAGALAATVKAAMAREAELGFGGGSRNAELAQRLLGCGDRAQPCEPDLAQHRGALLSSPGRIRRRQRRS